MTKKTETKTTRRPYCKPQLEQVHLVAEEAVLTNCKANQLNGPLGNNCRQKGRCYAQGT